MKCPVCSAEILDAADRFCTQCGQELPLPGPEVEAEAKTAQPQAGEQEVEQIEPEAATPPSPEPSTPEELDMIPGAPPGRGWPAQAKISPAHAGPQSGAQARTVVRAEQGFISGVELTEEQPCPNCGLANRPGARFCLHCGQALSVAPRPAPDLETPPAPDGEPEPVPALARPEEPATAPVVCPHCGVENRSNARFCLHCGQAMAVQTAPSLAADGPGDEPHEMEAEESGQETGASGEPDLATQPDETPSPAAEGAITPDVELETEATPPAEATIAAGQSQEATSIEAEAAQAITPDAESGKVTPPLLAVGTIIAQRYRVLEILPSIEEGRNLYAVADLQRCWNCERVVEDPGQPFCLECGADVSEPLPQHRLHLAEVPAPDDSEGLPDGTLVENQRLYALVPREAEPDETPFPQGVRLQVGQASDAGQVRDLDEDSVLALTFTGLYKAQAGPTVGLYIVADGIGGHEGGEVASRLAIQIIARELQVRILGPLLTGDVELPLLDEAVHDHLRQAVTTANEQIFQVRTSRDSDMGTTITLALVLDDVAYIANVGDSRTYLWGAQGLEQITADHSLIASLIASGMAEPEEIYTHPQRSAIYRSLGDKPGIEVDLFRRQLAPGNVLLLCCDGLWEMVREDGLESLLFQVLPPQAICDLAVQQANQAGGEDNISVVMVRVENNS